MTNWGGRMRKLVDRLRGEPTPEEKVRHLESVRRALYVEREAAALERRLDEGLASLVRQQYDNDLRHAEGREGRP